MCTQPSSLCIDDLQHWLGWPPTVLSTAGLHTNRYLELACTRGCSGVQLSHVSGLIYIRQQM